MKNLSLAFLLILGFSYTTFAKTAFVAVKSYNSAAITFDTGLPTLDVAYSQTNNRKSQLTEGNSLFLRISGRWLAKITKVAVSVKSNKSAGAGSLLMKMDNSVIWEIADSKFNSSDWYGAWSNTYVKIEQNVDNIVWGDSLVLSINASANSLYFDTLFIEYTEIAPDPYEVRFVTFTDIDCVSISEKQPGGGISLPEIEAPQGWIFIGWLATPVFDSFDEPSILFPNATFFPSDNTTLYAVYIEDETIQVLQDTSFQTGEYVLISRSGSEKFYILNGFPENGKVTTEEFEIRKKEDSLYYFLADFVPIQYRYILNFTDSDVSIMHKQSQQYIAKMASKNQLDAKYYRWKWEKAKNNSLLFYNNADQSYIYQLVVLADTVQTKPTSYVLEVHRFTKNTNSERFLLFPIDNLPEDYVTLYTSNPLNRDVSQYIATGIETHPLMPYRIDVHKNYEIYDLQGRKIGSTIQSLQKGIWILKQGKNVYKFRK